jgi:hypothetical protein
MYHKIVVHEAAEEKLIVLVAGIFPYVGVRSKNAAKFFIKSPSRQQNGRIGLYHVFLFFGLSGPGDTKAWGFEGFPLGWGEGGVRRGGKEGI